MAPLSEAFLAVTVSRQRPVALPASFRWLSTLLQTLRSASSGSRLPFSKAWNLRRASIHEPLGGRKVFSYGFETAACPPRKLQILRSASSLPPLQNLRSASSLSRSTAPTKNSSIHEPLGAFQIAPKPSQPLEPAPLTARNPPQRLEPAPLKAPNLRSGSRLPSSKASNRRRASIHERLKWPRRLPRSYTGRGVSRPFQQAAASSGISSQQLFVTVPRLPPAPLKTLPRFPAASSSEPAVWPLPNLSSLLYSQRPVVDSSQQLFLTVPRLPPA